MRKTRFKDLPIITKTRVMTILLTLFFLIIISVFTLLYNVHQKDTDKEAGEMIAFRTGETIDSNLSNIIESFVSTFGTEDMHTELYNIVNGLYSEIEVRTRLQEPMNRLKESSTLISSVIIISMDKTYTLFSNLLIDREAISKEELESAKGITFLSARKSPISSEGSVIPMVVPLAFFSSFITISMDAEDTVAYVVILLDRTRIENILNPDASSIHALSISNADGTILAGVEEGKPLSSVTLPFSNLVIHDKYRTGIIAESVYTIIFASAIALLLALLIILIESHILRRYVINPVKELEKAVEAIGKGKYDRKPDVPWRDELGTLGSSVYELGKTIENQIERISEEKAKQYKTEVRLLSEQLKPHFLYNTLECIQQEVNRGEKEEAADMIRDLSCYLRTTLSYGSETISIEDEVKHDISYIKIMNKRFSGNILFNYRIGEGLEEKKILKQMLQPFIENSIKHGFSLENGKGITLLPCIELSFYEKEGKIEITLSDNGKGFESESVWNTMTSSGDEGHVGLRNVYRRLCSFYGENNFSITLSSVPFAASRIVITVPSNE